MAWSDAARAAAAQARKAKGSVNKRTRVRTRKPGGGWVGQAGRHKTTRVVLRKYHGKPQLYRATRNNYSGMTVIHNKKPLTGNQLKSLTLRHRNK